MGSFRRLTISTLIAVYLLIFVGGVVRSSGSGMGCPDWPKCFGNWTPPSSVEELPANYKEIYSNHRDKKNQKFAKYLRILGMDNTADQLLNDRSVLEEADFNPVKTRIEYINRIIGVIIGLLILAVFIVSLKFRKSNLSITIASAITFVLVVFQGWIGSIVVSTNLTPWTITIHMFLALIIVGLLVWLVKKTDPDKLQVVSSSTGYWWTMACIAVLLVQILFGTNVREAIDSVPRDIPRENWIEWIGKTFTTHRSFSWIVLILNVGLVVNLRKTQGVKPFPLTVIVLILGTILTGVGMGYFGVPPWLQPLHLLLATVTVGMQFMLLLKLGNEKQEVVN